MSTDGMKGECIERRRAPNPETVRRRRPRADRSRPRRTGANLRHDYIQYDESGKSFTKQDVINNLKSGAIRYIAIISIGRRIRLLNDDVGIVHGSESNEVEQNGRRFPVRYVYMDVVVKRDGRWQIVGSQLARSSRDDRSSESRRRDT